jgi:hypothetical protein
MHIKGAVRTRLNLDELGMWELDNQKPSKVVILSPRAD